MFPKDFRLQRPKRLRAVEPIEAKVADRALPLGLVPHEIGARSPARALAALGGCWARTWRLRNRHPLRTDGYHLCDDTSARSMPIPARPALPCVGHQATQGQVLSLEEPISRGVSRHQWASPRFEESGARGPALSAAVRMRPSALPNVAPPLPATLLPGTPEPGRQRLWRRPPRFRGNEGASLAPRIGQI